MANNSSNTNPYLRYVGEMKANLHELAERRSNTALQIPAWAEVSYTGKKVKDNEGIDWAQVTYGGKTGWVMADTLRTENPNKKNNQSYGLPNTNNSITGNSNSANPTNTSTITTSPLSSGKPKDTSVQPQNPQPSQRYVGEVQTDLHEFVGSRSGTLSKIPAGAQVSYTGEKSTDHAGNSWAKISYDGKTGWVMADALRIQKPSQNSNTASSTVKPSASTDKAEKSQDSLRYVGEATINLHKNAEVRSDTKSQIPAWAQVSYTGKKVTDNQGIDWAEVTYDGKTGWVMAHMLRTEKPQKFGDNEDYTSILENTPVKENEDKNKEDTKKEEKEGNFIDALSTALVVASLIPGVDTFTNLASIPVDLLRGDWIGAGLDLFGAIPFVGEFADAAKTARTADKIIDTVKAADKAGDVAKASKIVDKITDTANNIRKSKVYQNMTKPFKEAVEKGIVSGTSSALKGKSFASGFMGEYVSFLGSEYAEICVKNFAKNKKWSDKATKLATFAATTSANVFTSSVTTFIAELEKSDEENWDDIAIEVAKSAGVAILSSVGGEYIDVAIDMANEAGSVANMLMEYDESMGKALKKFFDYLIIALSA